MPWLWCCSGSTVNRSSLCRPSCQRRCTCSSATHCTHRVTAHLSGSLGCQVLNAGVGDPLLKLEVRAAVEGRRQRPWSISIATSGHLLGCHMQAAATCGQNRALTQVTRPCCGNTLPIPGSSKQGRRLRKVLQSDLHWGMHLYVWQQLCKRGGHCCSSSVSSSQKYMLLCSATEHLQ
jgi:hypothetical protein